jgi:hypothetical protein
MDATQQVGTVFGAALWRGTPESRVDLHPAGVSFSYALGVRGDMQVGYVVYSSSSEHAALWRGTTASYVDLHPPGAARSHVYATDGVRQGGAVFVGSFPGTANAALWTGTAQSLVSLHPGGAYSYVYGMAPAVQVGEVYDPAVHRASVWYGTAASWTDLTPPGATGIWRFYATTGRFHVGGGTFTPNERAVLCFGTSVSWLQLHQFLPPGYTSWSVARSVYQDGDRIYVGGWAVSDATGQDEAFLWVGTDPCYSNCDLSTVPPGVNVADFTCFLQKFAARDGYANCDGSTTPPILNVADFTCFLQRFAAGCS